MNFHSPLKTLLESSASSALYDLIFSDSNQFKLVSRPQDADVILFENDRPSYIRHTAEYKQYPEKCIIVSEVDLPTFFLPACYASNRRCWLSKNRAITIPYILNQRAFANPFIKDFTSNTAGRYLYSFRGRSTSWVRKKLFKLNNDFDDVLIEEFYACNHENHINANSANKRALMQQYADLINRSLFFLCPQGAGTSSIRLFEIMQAGRVPVIIADDWIPVEGIPWSEFAIKIAEKDLQNLDQLIRLHEHDARQLGVKARQAWLNFCSPEVNARFLAQSIGFLQQARNEKRERFIRFIFPLLEIVEKINSNAKWLIKYCVLRTYSFIGIEFPYPLNRPMNEQLKRMESQLKA